MEIQSIYGRINGSPIIQALSLFIESREHKLKKVHELLSPDGMSWNTQALWDNFLIHDENIVSRIPLGRLDKDTWVWSAEKHGMYIVRSAYHLLISNLRMVVLKNNTACSSVSENNLIW